jgi:hypothetical protein
LGLYDNKHLHFEAVWNSPKVALLEPKMFLLIRKCHEFRNCKKLLLIPSGRRSLGFKRSVSGTRVKKTKLTMKDCPSTCDIQEITRILEAPCQELGVETKYVLLIMPQMGDLECYLTSLSHWGRGRDC